MTSLTSQRDGHRWPSIGEWVKAAIGGALLLFGLRNKRRPSWMGQSASVLGFNLINKSFSGTKLGVIPGFAARKSGLPR